MRFRGDVKRNRDLRSSIVPRDGRDIRKFTRLRGERFAPNPETLSRPTERAAEVQSLFHTLISCTGAVSVRAFAEHTYAALVAQRVLFEDARQPRDERDTLERSVNRAGRRTNRQDGCTPASGAYRSDLKAVRSSDTNNSGCSQAAKWPPLSTRL